MWFRALTFYQLNAKEPVKIDELSAGIEKRPFMPCSGLDWFTQGWVPAVKFQEGMIYSVREGHLVSLRREDKVLPPAVIREFTEAKAAEIEEKESRNIGRKEKKALTEQVTDDLLPHAFKRPSHMNAYIDTKNNWLVVDSSNANKSEALVSALRDVQPPFPAALPKTRIAPRTAMTDWLASGKVPVGFELDAECILRDSSEQGAMVRFSRMDLTAEEVQHNLASGKQVTALGLIWKERVRFVLTDTLQIKKIQFLDILQEEASQAGDDAPSLFEATFTLMIEEFREIIDALIFALDGLDEK